MELQFSFSLRKYFDEYFEEISRAIIIEDGVVLTGVPKPFVTIEYAGSNDEIIAAGRSSFEETFRYQIGLFTNSIGERARLQEVLREHIRRPDGIPIYDITTGIQTQDRFVVDVGEFTPFAGPDSSSETYKNYGYFIVGIEIMRNYGETSFTQ